MRWEEALKSLPEPRKIVVIKMSDGSEGVAYRNKSEKFFRSFYTKRRYSNFPVYWKYKKWELGTNKECDEHVFDKEECKRCPEYTTCKFNPGSYIQDKMKLELIEQHKANSNHAKLDKLKAEEIYGSFLTSEQKQAIWFTIQEICRQQAKDPKKIFHKDEVFDMIERSCV